MHNTSRLSLPVPDSTDAVSAYPADASTAFGILDNATIYKQGTLAARPAANTVAAGTLYYATDAGTLAWSNGTTWTSLNPVGRQIHSFTMDDQTSPNSAATTLGSFFISPASGETVTLIGAIIHCVTVGSTASVFALQRNGTNVNGLTGLTPSTTGTLVYATGEPVSLANLDRFSLVATTPGNSLGCTVSVITEHTL